MNAVVPDTGKELTAAVKLDSMIGEASTAIKTRAQLIVIASDADYVTASEFGSEIKSWFDNMEKERVKLKAPFLSGCNGIDFHYRAPLATLAAALNVVKERMNAWDQEKRRLVDLERKRQEEALRLAQEEAKRQEEAALAVLRAQEQAQRKAAEAEAARQRAAREEAEAKARSEAAARAAADAQASGDRSRAEAAEQAQRDAEAREQEAIREAAQERQRAIDAKRAQLRAERETQAAVEAMDSAKEAATAAAQTTVEPTLTHVAGNRRRTIWSATVKPGAEIPRKYLKLDEEALDAVVQRFKEDAQEFLGDWVIVSSKETLAIGGKK